MILKKISKIPYLIFKNFICRIRSFYYSSMIDQGQGKFVINEPFLRIKIKKSENSKLVVKGIITIESHLGGKTAVAIILEKNAILEIAGDFIIGNGVRLSVGYNALLYFGGKYKESGSGITSDTLIMANKSIIIGKDFLCAWGVFISDSDWHTINNMNHQADVVIGDHVWIANNSTVLKGSKIGDNSIIASQSKVSNKAYPTNSLLAGIPAKVVKTDITWSRDIK